MYVPTATYRLQFSPSFGFKEAEALMSYLHALGVSDIYASPIFKANKGSMHGYDVTNPNELNPELGSAEDFSKLTAKRKEYNLGWIQDIVPNHMAYSSDNQMLMDVFKNGRSSRYADFFDIDWDHPDESLKGRILAPFLGKPCSEALRDGEIQLERNTSGLYVRYYDICFPLALSSYDCEKSREDMPPLNRLLDKQIFKLSFWKRASESINYRRFFYLNDYIGLKMERPEVFAETHTLIREFVRRGVFTGLRVDHIDGLYDPAQYLNQLRRSASDTYIVVEKILELDESLPVHWPVQGTTGYEFCHVVNGVFVRTENERALTKIYRDFTNQSMHYDKLLFEKKRAVCTNYMAGDIDNLVHWLHMATRDCGVFHVQTSQDLKEAFVEIITALDVYRTYINNESYRSEDNHYTARAIDDAKRNKPALKETIDRIGQCLLLDSQVADDPTIKAKLVHFIMKFQQYTGPIMAKGFEDTLLYIYNRLTSLNEVGSNPNRFGISPDDFHVFNTAKASYWPQCLNATSTHDTKRGEDVRARIDVLSEMPEIWGAKVRHWKRINARLKSECHGIMTPNAKDEYLLYQTLIGTLPFDANELDDFKERIKQYITKVVREAKVHSSWIQPNEPYEQAFHYFIDCILEPSDANAFWSDFLPFQKQVAAYGIFNSLSQVLLKMTSPGIPDFYQGSELWDLSLVDPDNRKPVDFEKRIRYLEKIQEEANSVNPGIIDELIRTRPDARIKLFLIFKILNARRQLADLFEKGGYQPLEIRGQYNNHVIGFLRSLEDQLAVTIAPRFLTSVISAHELPFGTDVWKDTEVSWPESIKGKWQNVITDERVEIEKTTPVGWLLARFPICLLIRTSK